MNTTDQFGADPQMYTEDSSFPNNIYIQELKAAVEQVKQCRLTSDENGGCGSYSDYKLKDYLTAVERFVDNNIPALPTNSQPYTVEYMNDAMSLICSKVTTVIPLINDPELLSYLLDSYNHRLFHMLNLLMVRCMSVKDAFFLLQWVKKTYFR